jgi:hypothetical protein
MFAMAEQSDDPRPVWFGDGLEIGHDVGREAGRDRFGDR